MANTRSAAKRARQSPVRTERNQHVITGIKTEAKKLRTAVAAADKEAAAKQLIEFSSTLDKAAKRGIIHVNAANRRKSRAAKALAALNS